MAGTGDGSGEALDADVVAVDGDPDELRLAQGAEDAKAVYLAEARDAVDRARVKLARTEDELVAAHGIVDAAEAALAALTEG
jgi:hypothetical protein